MQLAIILLCVGVLVIGVAVGKPYGFWGAALGVLALLATVTNLLH